MIIAHFDPANPAAFDWSGFWGAVLVWLTDVGLKLLGVGAIVIGAVLLSWGLRVVVRRVVTRIVSGAKGKANVDDTQALERSPLAAVRLVQRTRTLGSILQNIINVAIVIVAVLLVVLILGGGEVLGSFTLLSAAIGAGLGFGAQNIVKDVLNGIFIVAEDQIGIGDVVDLGLATGIVEFVSVRVTHVRDVNGTLWYVRNGEITRIGNMSQGWARVIIDLAVPYDADIGQVEDTLLETSRALAKDAKWRTRVIDKPEVWGLESVSGDALVIRLVMKTRANAKDDVARELRMRIKHAIDDLGLRLPSLNSITLTGVDAASRVRGANPPRTRPNPTIDVVESSPKWRPRRAKKSASVTVDVRDAAAANADKKSPTQEKPTGVKDIPPTHPKSQKLPAPAKATPVALPPADDSTEGSAPYSTGEGDERP